MNPKRTVVLLLGLMVLPGLPADAKTARLTRKVKPAARPVSSPNKRKPIRHSPAAAPTRARLSSGADAPRSKDTTEKAALEIPELRTAQNVSDVTQALKQVPGVRSAVVDLNTHLAVVDFDPSATEMDHFILACKDVGFDAAEYRVETRFPKPIKLKGG